MLDNAAAAAAAGMGAVHKSPEVADPNQDWRLLLTVDDSCQDACCW
jgi:hypothetical protein